MKLAAALLFSLMAVAAQAQSVFPVRDSNGETRDRTYDVLHYRIEVSIDDNEEVGRGRVTTTLVPFLPKLHTVEFDAEQMTIPRVSDAGEDAELRCGRRLLAIHLDRPYSYRDTLKRLRGVFLHAQERAVLRPARFRLSRTSRGRSGRRVRTWTITSGSPATISRTTARRPRSWPPYRRSIPLLSNGKLLERQGRQGRRNKTYHWKQWKPHVPYLIMLAIGEYAVLRDKAGRLPLEYYVYPKHVAGRKGLLCRDTGHDPLLQQDDRHRRTRGRNTPRC